MPRPSLLWQENKQEKTDLRVRFFVEGSVLYTKNNESIQSILSQGRQVPKWDGSDAFIESISQTEPVVNSKEKSSYSSRTATEREKVLSGIRKIMENGGSAEDISRYVKEQESRTSEKTKTPQTSVRDGAAEIVRKARAEGMSVDQYLRENAELYETEDGWNPAARRALRAEGGDRYSIKRTSKLPFASQIKTIENGNMPGSDSLYIGEPSSSLQDAGFSQKPFAMNQGDYKKSRRESAKNKKYSSHGVPYEFFVSMPKYLGEAALLIDNGEKATIVTSYAMRDKKGNPSFVIAGVMRDTEMESDKVNLVKSVYPLDDFYNRTKKAAEEGRLVVINKSKAEQALATIGIQPSEVSYVVGLAKNSLSQTEPVVNSKEQNSYSSNKAAEVAEETDRSYPDTYEVNEAVADAEALVDQREAEAKAEKKAKQKAEREKRKEPFKQKGNPEISLRDLKTNLRNLYHVGVKYWDKAGEVIENTALQVLEGGKLTEEGVRKFIEYLYNRGVMVLAAGAQLLRLQLYGCCSTKIHTGQGNLANNRRFAGPFFCVRKDFPKQ